MDETVTPDMISFWMSVLERLNENADIYSPIPDILRDTCDFFDFGCGFIYQANYTSTFFLRESYILYDNNHLANPMDMKEMAGQENYDALAGSGGLSYSGGRPDSPLESAFGQLFRAGSLVLVPIGDGRGKILALVGLVDRRTHSRKCSRNPTFIRTILSALANHVKLHIYENRVAQTHHSLIDLVDNMGVDLYVSDYYTNEILFANQTMSAPYGGAKNLVGRVCWQALGTPGLAGPCENCPRHALIDEAGQPASAVSWEMQRPLDGRWMHVNNAAFPWTDGRLAHVVSSVDITESKRNEESIRQLAEYDVLTGLLNRRRLLLDVERDMAHMARHRGQGYLLFMDLDRFKEINDSLGHHAGDAMLVEVAARLQNHPLSKDHCYRAGGDEFVILLSDCTPSQLQEYLAYLSSAMAMPLSIVGQSLGWRASIGIAHYPTDGAVSAKLLHYADTAMYHSKQSGNCFHHYNQGRIKAAELPGHIPLNKAIPGQAARP